jgi:dihydroflavonol-4-reductase
LKQAVVTGATGLLGSHLSCHLRNKGYEVLCLHRTSNYSLFETVAQSYSLSPSDFKWQVADILNPEDLELAFTDCEVVFHCAAQVSFFKKDSQTLYENNLIGTRNVVNACILTKTPLVYASSVAALGKNGASHKLSEEAEWVESSYNSDYAISKHLAELEVWRGETEGLKTLIFSPGTILGLGDGRSSSNGIFKHVKSGSRFYPIGSTGFVGVKDVCIAMVKGFEQGLSNTRILLVSDNLSYQALLTKVAMGLGVKSPTTPLTGFLLKTAIACAKFCEFLHIPFPFPSQGLISTSSNRVFESKNLQKIVGFEFTSLDEVIKETCQALTISAKG